MAYFRDWFGRSAEEYIDILRDHGTRKVLYDMGMDEKEVEKLLKK